MRIVEGEELEKLSEVIEVARVASLDAKCAKDSRAAVVFDPEFNILGLATNGPSLPRKCDRETCFSICGLVAKHAERAAIEDALWKQANLDGASVLQVRTLDDEIQISGPLRCDDCSNYMRRVVDRGERYQLKEFILLQVNGWTAYDIREADEVTRINRGL